jgi:hypothetical protein
MIYSVLGEGHSMRVAFLALTAVAAVLFAAPTDARESQPCIPKATEALPHVSGLVIKQTRTRPVSTAILSTWQGQSRPIIVDIVDIDVIAAGAQETYSFMCVVTRGAAFVQRTMN